MYKSNRFLDLFSWVVVITKSDLNRLLIDKQTLPQFSWVVITKSDLNRLLIDITSFANRYYSLGFTPEYQLLLSK